MNIRSWYASGLEFEFLSRVHRSGYSAAASRMVERVLRHCLAKERAGRRTRLRRYLVSAIERSRLPLQHARHVLGTRVLVLKRWRDGERGVILADYSYVLPALIQYFDLERVMDRYFLVLEPSWSGYCTPEVLAYALYDCPVFVESIEPYDIHFLQTLGANLVPVPLAANWWVDHRLMKPDPSAARDIDVLMVAAWARFKRHESFFKAIRSLRERGHRLRVALVGYPQDLTRADIERLARAAGVADQVELHERLPPEAVAALFQRAKVHVLWSRREGVNRAILEAMLCDVPVIVRSGFNYGYRYPYINQHTGRFATEGTLRSAILEIIENRHAFSPREWVMANMSCQTATRVLERSIERTAVSLGEPWSEGLVVHFKTLDCQRYWNEEHRRCLWADYAFLESTIRS